MGCLHGETGVDPSGLIKRADENLYAAKRGGRNAWVGLYPADGVDPEQLKDRIPYGIAELLEQRTLEAKTSLSANVVLEWDGSA